MGCVTSDSGQGMRRPSNPSVKSKNSIAVDKANLLPGMEPEAFNSDDTPRFPNKSDEPEVAPEPSIT